MPTARMAKPSPTSANMPVLMMKVKEVVTGSGASGESSYFFALNIFMPPCRCLAPAHIAVHGMQECALAVRWPSEQCAGEG